MNEFTIDQTDFGIDKTKSTFSLDRTGDQYVLNAEVYGNPDCYDEICAEENSPWGWTLYPPHFYLRDFPAVMDVVTGGGKAKVVMDDLDEFEVAIYLIEHNDVDAVHVSMAPSQSIEVTGQVYLSDHQHEFSIKWHPLV